jgi:hypothetical protein
MVRAGRQMSNQCQISKSEILVLSFGFHLAGKCPDKPRPLGGFKGYNMKEISLPGSVALWAESFKLF